MSSENQIRYVRPDELNVDASYQRPLDENRMKPGSKLHPFNPAAVGTFEVSERVDGTLWLLDGQHRAEKARRSGYSRVGFPAVVHTGLAVAEEAAMFRQLNDFKQVHPLYRFGARVVEEDKAAVEMIQILTRHGWRVGRGGGYDGAFSAVSALERVYNGDKIRKDGGCVEACDRTIQVLTAAFGHSPHGVNGTLVHGVGLLFLRYDNQIDIPKLVTELSRVGANAVVGNAKALKTVRGGTLAHALAEILVGMHNRGRRSRFLPDWQRT